MSRVNVVKQVLKMFTAEPRFAKVMKDVKVISASEGKAEFQFKVQEDHLNQAGSLHGGMTATLVDDLSTYAIATTGENKFGVSVDMNITYIKAAFPDDVLNIKTEVYKTGKTLTFAKVDFYNQKGEILATGKHTKYIGAGVK